MEYTKISFSWSWLSLLLFTMLCASIEANSRNVVTMKETLPVYAITEYIDILNSTKCQSEMKQFRKAIDHDVLWGLRMLDASGVPPWGFINGNNFWLGGKNDCNYISKNYTLSLSQKIQENNSFYRNSNEEYPPYELHFFAARMRHNSTIQYHIELSKEDVVTLGLCLPASCTKTEIATMMDKVLHNETLLIGQLFSIGLTLIEITDLRSNHEWLLEWNIILIIIILVLLCCVIIICTAYDGFVYQKRLKNEKELTSFQNNNVSELKNDVEEKGENHCHELTTELKPQNKIIQFILCFSWFTTLKQIFQTEVGYDDMRLFHGMKFFGMIWIILVHALYYAHHAIANKVIAYRMTDDFFTQVLSNATLSVDTFFFTGGFLLTYTYLKSQGNKKKSFSESTIQIIKGIIRRYIRLTPGYLVVVMIFILNFTWMEKVSMIPSSEQIHVLCTKYWWRNILYINNLFPWNEQCLSWSWYLPNDMHFFIFGSIILTLMNTHYNIAMSISVITIISSIFTSGYLAYNYNYIPALNEQYEMLTYFYLRPWTRIPPYLIGMGTCLLLTKWNYKLHLSKKTLFICWTLAILCNCSILFGLTNKNLSLGLSILYTALSRTAWAFGVAWFVIACCTNNCGLISKFLSNKIFFPMSRLTYACYLLNPAIILSLYSISSYPFFIDYVTIAGIFLVAVLFSYTAAVILSASAEAPFIMLLRLIQKKETK